MQIANSLIEVATLDIRSRLGLHIVKGLPDMHAGSMFGVAPAFLKPRSSSSGPPPRFGHDAGFWGQRYPAIGQSWRRAWSEVILFFAFPDEVPRIGYTANAIEALNSKLLRAVRARGHFPSDDAATKRLYLILNRSDKEWKMPPREWSMAKAQFAVIFGKRFIKATAA